MKDIRRRQILKEQIAQALNDQVKMEAQSAAAYLAMAGWCDVHGFDNSATFFYNQSEEERNHQMKLFHYIADMDGIPVSPAVGDSRHDFSSLRSVFEAAMEMEMAVTDAIHDIVRLCRKEGDIATEEFMRWFVQEQIEEEYVARMCLEVMDMYGDDKMALAMFEERLPGISYDPGGEQPA